MKALLKNHEEYSKKGGVFAPVVGVIRIAGPDAQDFLNRLSSQDFKHLADRSWIKAALLTPRATIIGLGDVYRDGLNYWWVCEPDHIEPLVQEFNKLHFSEDLTVTDESQTWGIIEYWPGSKVEPPKLELIEKWKILDFFVTHYKVTHVLRELLRLEAGLPTWGIDFTEKNLILEGPFEEYVSRTKGCYPGQEVVEKIHTYGNVTKKLVALKISHPEPVDPAGDKILWAEKNGELVEVGHLTQVQQAPWSLKLLIHAWVKKPFFEKGQKAKMKAGIEFTVEPLPHSFQIKESKS